MNALTSVALTFGFARRCESAARLRSVSVSFLGTGVRVAVRVDALRVDVAAASAAAAVAVMSIPLARAWLLVMRSGRSMVAFYTI